MIRNQKEELQPNILKYIKTLEIAGKEIVTEKVTASDGIKDFAIGLTQEGELLELNIDWEIINHKEVALFKKTSYQYS